MHIFLRHLARWNTLATTPSTKISCARLLSEHKYTVKINNPWSFQPGPPLERHLMLDKRRTGSLECTLIAADRSKEKDSVHLIQARVVLAIYHIVRNRKD